MCRWEGNIEIDSRDIGNEGVDWIELAENEVAGSLMWKALCTFRSYKSREYFDSLVTVSGVRGTCTM
jgi:hypothetical protein